MAIKRVNKMLCIILGILITVVIVSYYFVITSEMKLNEISRQTIVLNNENTELQNQLDSLKSFNNVDKTLQQNNINVNDCGTDILYNEKLKSSKTE